MVMIQKSSHITHGSPGQHNLTAGIILAKIYLISGGIHDSTYA